MRGRRLREMTGWVRGWELWKHNTLVGRGLMVAFELVMAAWVVIACAVAVEEGAPSTRTWVVFGLLCAVAGVHVYSTRHAEERRRVARLAQEYIDHSGVWKVAAALLLPAHLVVVFVVAIRLQRWTLAHKAPYRVVYGTAAILGSALAANAVVAASPLRAWFTGGSPVTAFPPAGVLWLGAAVVAYFAAQTVMIAVVRGCWRGWTWTGTIGERQENAELAACISLGTTAAALTAIHPALLVLVVGVCVFWSQNTVQLNAATLEARVDSLTSVYNRRGFDERVSALLGSRRAPERAAVLMLDLDHFKHVNDRHGHPNGDRVLTALAATVSAQTRHGDLVCRKGGEEFMVFLPHASLGDALVVAERIRHAATAATVPATRPAGGEEYLISGLSLSVGVATYPGDGTTIDELEERADAAVYRAKRDGRNRVRVAADANPPVHRTGQAGGPATRESRVDRGGAGTAVRIAGPGS